MRLSGCQMGKGGRREPVAVGLIAEFVQRAAAAADGRDRGAHHVLMAPRELDMDSTVAAASQQFKALRAAPITTTNRAWLGAI